MFSVPEEVIKDLYKGPFTLAIFAAILAAIFAAILAAIFTAISWRFHGDFKSPL